MSLCDRRILHNLKARRRAHVGSYLGFKPSPHPQISTNNEHIEEFKRNSDNNKIQKGKPL